MYRKYVINLYRLLLLFHFQWTLQFPCRTALILSSSCFDNVVNGSVSRISGRGACVAVRLIPRREPVGVHPPPYPRRALAASGNRAPTSAAGGRRRRPSRSDITHVLTLLQRYRVSVWVTARWIIPCQYASASAVRCVSSIRIVRLAVVCKWICLFLGIIVVPEGSPAIDIAHACGIKY